MRLARFGRVDVLKADFVLLIALIEYGDGVAIIDAHNFAGKLKGRDREGQQESEEHDLLHAHELTPAPWPVKAEVGAVKIAQAIKDLKGD